VSLAESLERRRNRSWVVGFIYLGGIIGAGGVETGNEAGVVDGGVFAVVGGGERRWRSVLGEGGRDGKATNPEAAGERGDGGGDAGTERRYKRTLAMNHTGGFDGMSRPDRQRGVAAAGGAFGRCWLRDREWLGSRRKRSRVGRW